MFIATQLGNGQSQNGHMLLMHQSWLICRIRRPPKRKAPCSKSAITDNMLPLASQQVGMATGATIHTANGMPMKIERRKALSASSAGISSPAAVAV